MTSVLAWSGLEAALLNAMQQAVFATDECGRTTYWNPYAERLFGWTAEEMLGQLVHERLSPKSFEAAAREISAAVLAGTSWTGEATVKRRDGTTLPVVSTISPIYHDGGAVAGMVGIVRDASERHRIRADRERLAAIVTNSDDAILTWDLNGPLTSWNPGAERLYGYRAEEMLRPGAPTLVPADRQAELQRVLEDICSGERVQHIETQRIRKDGQRIDISLSISPLHDAHGAVVAFAAIARDITTQKANQRQLEDAERRLRSLFMLHPDAVFALDADGNYSDVNPGCERLSGYPAEEILGRPFGERSEIPELSYQALRTTMKGRPVTYESTLVARDGRHIPVEGTLVPIVVDGATVGVYGITRDISDWKRVEYVLAAHARQQAATADLGLLALTDIGADALLKAAVDAVASLMELQCIFVDDAHISRTGMDSLVYAVEGRRLSNDDLRQLFDSDAVRITDRSSGLATAIPGREQSHGVLLAWSDTPRTFSEDDVTFLQEVANVVGAAIDNSDAANELRRRESELKVLVETTSDNIVRLDRALRYMYVNPAFERMVQRPASELLGQTPPVTPAATQQVGRWERAIRRVFRTGEVDEIETGYKDRYYHVRISPEFGPDGDVNSVLAVGRDITATQQREAERAQLYQELLERDTRLHQLVERVLLRQQDPTRPRLHTEAAAEQFNVRERRIIQLLARGMTNREIAHEVNLRPSTVKNYVANLLPRLNASDRTQAAVVAAQLGLLEGDSPD